MFMTFAFGINKRFLPVYESGPARLRYALLDKLLAAIPVIKRNLDHSDAQHAQVVEAILAGDPGGLAEEILIGDEVANDDHAPADLRLGQRLVAVVKLLGEGRQRLGP